MFDLSAHLHFDLVEDNTLIEFAHVLFWQVSSIIDAPIVPLPILQENFSSNDAWNHVIESKKAETGLLMAKTCVHACLVNI